MQALNKSAQEAGITVVNEVGLDPGIDHFLAMECFDDVHTGGGKVESFVSFCGGLPAPEASDNPLGYKFSWSPRGALMNMLSGGTLFQDFRFYPKNLILIFLPPIFRIFFLVFTLGQKFTFSKSHFSQNSHF